MWMFKKGQRSDVGGHQAEMEPRVCGHFSQGCNPSQAAEQNNEIPNYILACKKFTRIQDLTTLICI